MDVAKFCVLMVLLLSSSTAYSRSFSKSSKKHYNVVCYLGSWANYRQGDGKFVIEDIDPNLCTHLIYGFAKLGYDNKIAAYDPYLDLKENWGLGAYERFNNLKKKNSHLKTLLAIGGWNEGSTKYSNMARTASSRKVFVDSCVEFLTKYGFDGLDMDWEYPANRGGSQEDKKNFVLLLRDLKEAFDPRGLLLTAAVSAGESTIDSAYDIPALAKYLDLINLMAYDFHGGWDTVTGHNAPLYPRSSESAANKKLNVDYAVKYWMKNGAPAHKLILGIPLYGRSFTLQSSTVTGFEAPVTGKGMAGEFTREPGMLGYNEICSLLKKEKGWKIVVDNDVQAPYCFKDRQWIGYDDIRSVPKKVDYLRKMKLGGAMVWSIETDDFRGKCHSFRYPLLTTINSVLNGTSVPLPDETGLEEDNDISPTRHSSSSSPRPSYPPVKSSTKSSFSTTKSTDGTSEDFLPCPSSGYFRHPTNCKLFYICQPKSPTKDMGYRVYLFHCGAGTVFNEEFRTCAFPDSVPKCS
ncbi:chitinase-3-like protein 1 [Uloborus diversus]|uniref:chitinase-3-like protein 1 n=1 Tax=Uloborus diversus TaxID=327109 RepID=UPI00240A22A4|nr:chitinase-3-like protein 1 [Uloborus diversus]